MKTSELLKLRGAIVPGHFVLKSGMHSDTFCNVPILARRPIEGRQFSDGLAAQFADYNVETVVGVASGGLKFASWVAEKLEGIHSERHRAGKTYKQVHCVDTRKTDKGQLVIDPIDAAYIANKRCVVIDDLATTGGTIHEVEKEIFRLGGLVVGVGALVRRGNNPLECFEVFKSFCHLETNECPEQDCKQCKEGVPIDTSYGHGS